ncbi:MAG TPA: site-specific DNA-methyltransferase [Bacteroidota bacterium]|nr:site-specific DNA-methyltransferase [Bacteroidota bacterium]
MTELIWEGKYKDGKKVAPVRIALPFQTIETINESTEDRKRNLDLFAGNKPTEWRNRLIWGDKKYVLPSLLPEFEGKVNLIYIDPPFDTGADFSFTATIPDHPDTEEDESTSFVKEPSIIEQKAYRDTWGKGLDSYLQWFYETVVLLRELLADNGSIYVHLDWHVGHYAKAVMDEVFGEMFIESQIIWQRVTSHSDTHGFGFNHDMILLYAKSQNFTWNPQFVPHDESYIKSHYTQVDKDGRRFRWDNATAAGQGEARRFFGKLIDPPPGTHWRWSQENIDRLIADGRIELTSKGMPQYKRYLDEMKGKVVQSVWTDIHPVNSQAKEDTKYATQKPEALLERIIKASSNEGDLVLDCFCGSGTTAAVAEKLNRRWIACDLGRFAIHTTRKRLLQIPNVKPFVVQNLGKYERQQWASAEFANPEDRAAQERAYRKFIIELYHGQPINGYAWLHGVKAGRMLHVGAVDSPVALGDVKAIIQELWRAVGKDKEIKTNGIDILGWEFAFDINETAAQQAAASKVDVKFKKIPREVLEKKAVEQGDIHFYELAALDVKVNVKGKSVELKLKDFVVPPDDVPEEVRKAIVHWSQWIDYWAVDWDYKEDTFHNQWQSYRTKKNPKIELAAKFTYEAAGTYTVVVKVIDILGNDTTKLLQVEVG